MYVSRSFQRSMSISLCVPMALLTTGSCGREQRADIRGAADVQALVESMSSGAVAPRSWKGAKAGELQPTSENLPERMCMVRSSAGEAGYVLTAGGGEAMHVVMLSGSRAPMDFIGTLAMGSDGTPSAVPVKEQSVSNAAVMAFLLDQQQRSLARAMAKAATQPDPFLARLKTQASRPAGTAPAMRRIPPPPPSATASCLATMLSAWQASDETVPFLFVGGTMDINEYWHRMKPLLAGIGSANAAGWETPNGFVPDMPAIERFQRQRETCNQVLRAAGLIKDIESKTFGGGTIKAFTFTDPVRAFEVQGPLWRTYLAGKITPYERLMAMREEETHAPSPSREYLFEGSYLKAGGSLEKEIEEFGRTRGFDVLVSRKSPTQVAAGELPALLIGPGGQAAILMAVSSTPAGWGLVYIPQTGSPLPEMGRRRSGASSAPSPGETAMMIRAFAQGRSDELAIHTVFGDDRREIVPTVLDHGGHLVALACLETNWKALVIGKWRPLDNWDLNAPARETPAPPPVPEERRQTRRRGPDGWVPPPLPPGQADRFLPQAQLRVLSVMVDEARGTAESRNEQARMMVEDYVAQGMPREAFSSARLKQAALQSVVEQLLRGSGIRAVVEARRKYHIDPQELYPLLPLRKQNAVLLFREYLRTQRDGAARTGSRSDALRKIRAEPLDRESVRGVVEAAEAAGPPALPAALEVLWSDWSSEGRDYLYRQLQLTTDTAVAEKILRTLSQREEVDAAALSKYVEGCSDEKALSAAFHLAEGSLRTEPQARQFLLNELKSSGKRQRELAMRALCDHTAAARDIELIRSAIRDESNHQRRIGLLASLGRCAGDPALLTLLRDLIANDASPDVRIAAIQAIPDHSIADTPVRETDDFVDLISVDYLRELTAKADPQVRAAAEAKITSAADRDKQLIESHSRIRNEIRRLQTRPDR